MYVNVAVKQQLYLCISWNVAFPLDSRQPSSTGAGDRFIRGGLVCTSAAYYMYILCAFTQASDMNDRPVRRSRVCSFDRSLVRSLAAVSNGSAFCCRQTSRTRTRIDIERERIATCPWSLNLNYTHFHCSQPLLLWCYASPLFFNGRHNALCSFCLNIFTPLPYCLLKWNIAHGVECARAYSKYQS